jgi:hypothetical protein
LTLHREKTIPSLVASYEVSSVDVQHRLGAQANATKAKHQSKGNTLRERDLRVP